MQGGVHVAKAQSNKRASTSEPLTTAAAYQSTEPWSRRFFRKKLHFPFFFCFFSGFQSQIRRMQNFSRLARPVINSSVAMCACINMLFKSRYLSCCAKEPRFTRVHSAAFAGVSRPPPPPRRRWRTLRYTLGHIDIVVQTTKLVVLVSSCLANAIQSSPGVETGAR